MDPGSIMCRGPFSMCYIKYGPTYKLDLGAYSMGVRILYNRLWTPGCVVDIISFGCNLETEPYL